MKKTFEKKSNILEGNLAKNIIIYTIPTILTGVLQLLFNATDTVMVGSFAGHSALASVGATGALINLIVNVFMGLSVGASVCVAQYYGSKNKDGVSQTTHTAMILALVMGVFVAIFGFVCSRTFLEMMGTPKDVIDGSTLYMRIYFLGMPANMLYNFGAGILRSQGDTRNPMIYLTISGFLNVGLNALFMIVFHMTVDGVAWGTVASQYLSAILITAHLFRTSEWARLELSKMRITVSRMKRIIRIGLPAGLQSFLFSCGNVVVQSSVNSFGGDFMAGNTAAQNIEGFIWIAMNAFQHTSLTFVGQHLGAKKVNKIPKIIALNVIFVTATGVLTAALALIFRYPLLSLYLDEESIIETAIDRLFIIAGSYFLCGIMDAFTGALRGLGNSVVPMVLTVISVCGVRITWVFTAFKILRDTDFAHIILYVCYPLSWILAITSMAIATAILYKKLKKSPLYAECFENSAKAKKKRVVVNEA